MESLESNCVDGLSVNGNVVWRLIALIENIHCDSEKLDTNYRSNNARDLSVCFIENVSYFKKMQEL